MENTENEKAFHWDFGQALTSLKKGNKVCRDGWNGKGMYLLYIPENGYYVTKLDWPSHEQIGNLSNLPFIAMKTADNKIVPWLASQTDILANDWCLLP